MKGFLIISILFLSSFATSQSDKNQSDRLKDLNVDYMIRGYFYAGSMIEDKDAFGHWAAKNYPQKLEDGKRQNNKDFYFDIETSTYYPFKEEYKGYKIRLINETGRRIEFDAQDSRLNIVCQAYHDGKWQDIEYLPSSWCGNSYHKVFISNNEYWEFVTPVYHGQIECLIRYKLQYGEKVIYSESLNSNINPGQFKNKEGHIPSGIMDPYVD